MTIPVCASDDPADNGENLVEMQKNSADWVMPSGTYDNNRFSNLDQINVENAGKLKVAWTFSTGVLRGHEGGPLVIGSTMYVHTPFPNIVYALDLNNDGVILWKYVPIQDPSTISVMCCDTVKPWRCIWQWEDFPLPVGCDIGGT